MSSMIQEAVLGFYIPIDDSSFVGTLQRQRDFRPVEGRGLRVQHPFLAEVVEQLAARAIFEAEDRVAPHSEGEVQFHDVRVL